MRNFVLPILLAMLWGCQPNPQQGSPYTQPPDPIPTNTTTTETWTSTTTSTTTTPTTGPCAPGAPGVLPSRDLTWPGEEFAFDRYGNFVTVSDWSGAAWHMTFAGVWTNHAPFSSPEVAGVDFLADGTLVVADEGNGAIKAIDEAGSSYVIAGSIDSPNSVVVGPDGMIYTTAYDNILRIDPDTGETEDLGAFGGDLDGLAFTADGMSLFFNVDEAGEVWRMGFDANGDVTATVRIHTFNGGWGPELNGMTTDVCNNLYVLDTSGMIHRIGPNGVVVEDWVDLAGTPYSSALHFGSGVGGWETDHLYIQDRNGTLFELDIGIEGTPEPHLP